MITLKTLTTKRILKLNMIEIKDLFQSTFKIFNRNDDQIVEYQEIHEVTEYEIGRPDLISNKYFNSPNYVDGILKYNSISNPFSLNSGTLLKIPTKEVLDRSYRVLTFKTDNPVEKRLEKFISLNKKGNPDETKSLFNSSKKRKLPPNVLINGETGIKRDIKNNKIILGSNLNNI